ncbi:MULTISPECIES: ead/Ea22-like family protein [Serratia]|uniref:ead/Ea22-like family protein n=1 Tax=Serratia TaxID=613 RepID=UPI00076050AF|nr:ead/Ea22-like family protein [Serratia marcescens]
MDKFSELKAAAMAATPGPWGINRTGNTIVSNQSHPVATVSDAFHRQLAGGGVGKDAEFIAAANPAAVLELLAERDADKKHIAELERANQSQDDHINQQQDRIDSMEKTNAVLGQQLGDAKKRLATQVQSPGFYKDADGNVWLNPVHAGFSVEGDA